MKFKSKISYLGEKISILPLQMAEQLAVEVDVKNVTEQQQQYTAAGGQAHLFCLDSNPLITDPCDTEQGPVRRISDSLEFTDTCCFLLYR